MNGSINSGSNRIGEIFLQKNYGFKEKIDVFLKKMLWNIAKIVARCYFVER